MRWFADEDVDRPIVDHLRERGEEVWSASEECPGAPDDAVLRLAGQHSAILITADKDFGELVFRQKRVPFGVVLLRIAGLPLAAKADLA